MPEYLAPGVYVEEVEIGAKPIEGVSTSTAGFLGKTERGPTDIRLVTGFEEFQRLYGSYIEGSYLAYAVEGFFRNGGKRCFIGRIVESDAKKANGSVENMKFEAVGEGEWGNNVAIEIGDASRDQAGESETKDYFKLTVSYRRDKSSEKPDFFEVHDNLSMDPKSSEYYFNKLGGQKSSSNLIKAILDNSKTGKDIKGTKTVEKDIKDPKTSGKDNKDTKTVKKDTKDAKTADNNIKDTKTTGKDVTNPKAQVTDRPKNTESLNYLDGGVSGTTLEPNNFKDNNIEGEKTGLAAFEEVDEISILYVPDLHFLVNDEDKKAVIDDIVTHCEKLKDRFAILEASNNSEDYRNITKLRPPKDSKYAAFYYPWIGIYDPLVKGLKYIPPGGHIAGIYARSDTERGVHKAPANEIVSGANDLELKITKGEQEILNPRGVNCIRAFQGRGIRVWGARTTSSDPLWKYVNVRRLFLFLEESIDEGTQWVVFEPNDEKLWARVKQTISQFLTQVWKDGALMGTTPEEAFFVKCDRTTMTQNDIDNGRLIVMIGVAPVKPAEFVIFRIAQWTASAES